MTAESAASPMMAQYHAIKAEAPDALLFYRMGDFYEMFFDDAVAAAEALDIALTKRGTHAGAPIPMCGVPVHAAEGYLLQLIRKGFRVAVCEQMEDPAEARKRGSKSVVHRQIVRLLTPGTLTEDSLLEARRANYLAAVAEIRGEAALAWSDISTGELRVMPCPLVRLAPELARLAPREILVSEGREADLADIAGAGAALTPLSRASFDSEGARARLAELFGTATLDGFAAFGRAELAALGALVSYVEITQRGRLPLLEPPIREVANDWVEIDPATRRSLELTQAQGGGREGSLLASLDRTASAGGARLLERRLGAPSRRLGAVRARLEATAFFVDDRALSEEVRAELRRAPDLDRALSRLALGRGGPRDLAAVRAALSAADRIAAALSEALPEALEEARASLRGHTSLLQALETALVSEPPLLARDGGFVAEGHDADLDEARRFRDEGRAIVAALQGRYADETGIASLKVRHNAVLGYFVETTATHSARMLAPPLSARFVHRQTTANAVRFTTGELAETESRILGAGAQALEIEGRIFEELREAVLDRAAPLAAAARGLAEIDVAAGFAAVAREGDWCRPTIDESRAFRIEGGRHPVVEQALRREGRPFVANDCDLSAEGEAASLWLVTGPNMAGKSTFLRQNALAAILAQAGSYVPARAAHIGLVSQVFSRVGASDDLARGRSTFMVEMVETAAILNQADARALVILDEIGRGTATWDGLSIAWAVLEHLHDVNRCRGLFATHYHEMTRLEGRLPGLANATVAVREWEGEVVFLHEVRRGAADRSYGVQVARLAGLPKRVIARARVVLEALEAGERQGGAARHALIDDLPLFAAAAAPPPAAPPGPSPLAAALAAADPDAMTPREALDLLYRLKALAGD